MRTFIRICCKLMKIWDHKLANFRKETYTRGKHWLPKYISLTKFVHIFMSLQRIFMNLAFYYVRHDKLMVDFFRFLNVSKSDT